MFFVDLHEIKKGFSEWKQDTDVGEDLSTTLPANASFRPARNRSFGKVVQSVRNLEWSESTVGSRAVNTTFVECRLNGSTKLFEHLEFNRNQLLSYTCFDYLPEATTSTWLGITVAGVSGALV